MGNDPYRYSGCLDNFNFSAEKKKLVEIQHQMGVAGSQRPEQLCVE
jgi:hypothetical protein